MTQKGWYLAATISALCLLASPWSVSSEPPICGMPSLDNRPPQELFQRPDPFATISGRTPKEVLNFLLSVSRKHGFSEESVKVELGTITASRKVKGKKYAIDRIYFWLERDMAKPSQKIHVHLRYGRFERVLGKTESLALLASDETFENRQIGALKREVRSLALGEQR